MKHMLTCRQVEEFIGAYFSGELSLVRRLRFELHLAMCAECRRYLQDYRTAVALGKRVFDEPDLPAEDLPEDLIQAILSARDAE